jgi:hypothetical protein
MRTSEYILFADTCNRKRLAIRQVKPSPRLGTDGIAAHNAWLMPARTELFGLVRAAIEPHYAFLIGQVVTVSVETVKLVQSLPEWTLA